MLSVQQLFDYIGAKGLCDSATFSGMKEEEFTELHRQISMTDFTDIDESVSPMVYLVSDVLIHEKKYHDAAVLFSKAYRMFRAPYINDYWLVQEILKEGKDITVKNIEDHLNRPPIPIHLKMLGRILDSYVKNPSKDLTVYRYGCISSVEAREFLSNYPLYKRRKLMRLSDQERIKAEFLAKIQHMLKK